MLVTWFVVDCIDSQPAPVDVVKGTAEELAVDRVTLVATWAPTGAVNALVPVRLDGFGTSTGPLLPLVLYWTVNVTVLTPEGFVAVNSTDAVWLPVDSPPAEQLSPIVKLIGVK